jgi:thiamine-phosphate pyrophosphorylase
VAFADFDLYLVTDRKQTKGRDLLWVLENALDAGVKAIQLREKDLPSRDLFLYAEKLKKLCDAYRAELLINDRTDVALAVDAAGVQLGEASIPISDARGLLGAQKLIGFSIHTLSEAIRAEDDGADFVLFGPIYFTPEKARYGQPQGLARLKEIVEKTSLPVYAIGGIKVNNVKDVVKTGVRGVSLISEVIAADDPKSTAADLLRVIQGR